LKDLEGRIKN
jgi:uncharacterized protein YlbG (UPF0298 family)